MEGSMTKTNAEGEQAGTYHEHCGDNMVESTKAEGRGNGVKSHP